MDVTQQGILLLLKSAITQEPQVLPDGFDIETAYPLIRKHHMATLCYDGAVRCGVPRQHPVMQRLFKSYCKAMQVSEGQLKELRRIYKAFDEKGINYMPLKGCNMKALYPKPELRIMGDADILIRTEQYDRIVPIMESLGFTTVTESDHELIWQSSQLYLELHKHLIPSYNKDYYAYFGDGWNLAEVHRGCRSDMALEDTFVYMLTHFAKHYRDGGIGCRHVVDLWVYLRANPEWDEERVHRCLEALHLQEFYENLCQLIKAWFECGPASMKTDIMSEFIFSSGSWGEGESRALSLAVRDRRHSIWGFSGRLMYFFQRVFPGVSAMGRFYPVLKKAPWLLPVIWILRLFQKLLFEPGSWRKKAEILKSMSREKLDERQQMLRYVGLDYHF